MMKQCDICEQKAVFKIENLGKFCGYHQEQILRALHDDELMDWVKSL